MWNSVAPSRDALPGALPDFFERIGVRAAGIFVAPKRAQLAMRAADVGGIDVPVDVEVADVAVALFAHIIRQPANGQQIARGIEREAVLGGKPLAGEHFFSDGLEAVVRDVQLCVHLKSGEKRANGAEN